MPAFDKSSPELVSHFNDVLARHAAPDVVLRKMFGYPCAWINGNMASGLFAEQWWVNLGDDDREALLALPDAHPFEVMPGRSMGRNVTMPASVVDDAAALDGWIAKALDFTRTLPPKKK
jgi:hypothetical protein